MRRLGLVDAPFAALVLMAQLLGPTDVRLLADRLNVRPAKQWGQNFVVDAGTVRRIARIARIEPGDHVLEVGPGLGSLTLALLEAGGRVTAVEIDPRLAGALPETVAQRAPDASGLLAVIGADALRVSPREVADAAGADAPPPRSLVANLPYNVSVPVILHALEAFPSLERVLVMVQAEVADRVVAPPGSRTYGIPSAKVAWYGSARLAGDVARSAFFPVPRVDSRLVLIERREQPVCAASREDVFALIDIAFGQRRKALRGLVRDLAGSSEAASRALASVGIDPLARGETLDIGQFARLADALAAFREPGASGTVGA